MSDHISALRVKIFADGADQGDILELARNPLIQGFTTNPTLMRKAGVTDYECFGRSLTRRIPDRPFSFEVFSDDFTEMERQALRIASWGENVYVKIPITNTRPERGPAGGTPGAPGRQGERNRDHDAGAGGRRAGRPEGRPAQLHLDLRRTRRRRRSRSTAYPARRFGPHVRPSADRADLGQPARAVQYRAGRRHRLPHHHRHARIF